MFNTDKDDYPANAAGQPEFASIILTIDPVTSNAEGDDVVQKIVLSTQDPIDALVKVAAYFGEPTLLGTPQNGRLLVEYGRHDNPVFVYVTPREGTTQIITSTPTWDMLVQHPDFGNSSSLLASEKIQEIAAQAQGQLAQFAGGFSTLMLLDLSPGRIEEGEQPDSASSEGGRGETAESLRDTAEVESTTVGASEQDSEPSEG